MDRSLERDFTALAAYALTGDRHAAQDLVQPAFAKAFLRCWYTSAAPCSR